MRDDIQIQAGDRVAYSAAWLRSCGIYTGPLPFARGAVETVVCGLATIRWGDPEVPSLVHVANLVRADRLHLEPR